MGPCSCGIKLSRTLKEKFRCQLLSCVWLLTTSWTVRLLCPWNYPSKNTGVFFSRGSSPGDLPHPGIKPGSPAFEAESLLSQLPRKLTHTHTHTHKEKQERRDRAWGNFVYWYSQKCLGVTFLMVFWLRLCTPNAGGPVRSLVRELDPTCHN